MLNKSILLSLLLVFVPANAYADGCTENCVVEINCTTGVTVVREMTAQELANRPVFNLMPEPVATPTPQPTTETINNPVIESVVTPTPSDTATATIMPQPPQLKISETQNKVIVNAATNTAEVIPLTIEEIIELWLINWEVWFARWSEYMNEQYSL
jgi:hypothetical protein